MKNLLFLLLVIILTSCRYSTPKLNTSVYPFIVVEIRRVYGSTELVKYISDNQNTEAVTMESSQTALIAPKGMYNIGDTIRLNNKSITQ